MLTVAEGEADRLDVFLSRRIEGLSRRKAAGMIADGQVTVNDRPADKGRFLCLGDAVEILRAPVLSHWSPKPDASLHIPVVFRDEYLAVLDKPSGISTVPLDPSEMGTVANFAAAAFPQCADIGRRAGDGGLLQRLDRETSGAVMAALTPEAYAALAEAQTLGGVEKLYLALVRGVPPRKMHIDTRLSKFGPKGAVMRPSEQGAAAHTTVTRLSLHGDWTLVAAVIHHGVRHQIRAHLASEGFPLAGDPLYGDGGGPPGLTRLFLHAEKVTFIHPVSRRPQTVVAPLPAPLDIF